MSVGLWPSFASSTGSAPQTSANPPVLANGTASLAASRIFTRPLPSRSPVPRRFLAGTTVSRRAGSPHCRLASARQGSNSRLRSHYHNGSERDNFKGVAPAKANVR